MGECDGILVPSFNGSIRIEGRPERLTDNPGAILLRETTERLDIIDWLDQRLDDPRNPLLLTHPLSELLRTELCLLGQGWRDQDDADHLRDDAALRLAVSDRRGTAPLAMRPREQGEELPHNPSVPDGLASQPTLSRLHRSLSTEDNRQVLRDSLLESTARRVRTLNRDHRLRYLALDIDSLPAEVYGHQPGSEYNGHYHARIYHPLVASIAETGDIIDLRLRKGSVHTAEGSLDFILPLLDRVERRLCQVASVRIDAGFPDEPLLAALEARRTPYVARIKNNPVLDRMAEPYIKRPVGRRTKEPRVFFYEMTYRAESWSRERRVVLVVLERADDLFLHHFWLITSWSPEQMEPAALLEMYRQRGKAEAHFGELMNVLDPALSSAPRPKATYCGEPPARRYPSADSFELNEVRLLLNALAYNLMNTTRILYELATGRGTSLRRLRERLLRTAARVLIHGRSATVVLGQAACELWAKLWPVLCSFEVAHG
jgi:hypothetical protein